MKDSEADKEEVENTNSGIKKKGDWEEIAEFGEKVGKAVKDTASDESVERFEDWRPKLEESEKDVKRKTVEEATLKERQLEMESDGVPDDLKQASGKIAEAGKKAAKGENPEKEVIEASADAAKPFYSKIAGFFRQIESKVYSWFALRFNPYYLDTEDFSVDVRHRKKGEFEMDVAVPEEEKRNDLKQSFEKDSE